MCNLICIPSFEVNLQENDHIPHLSTGFRPKKIIGSKSAGWEKDMLVSRISDQIIIRLKIITFEISGY